jgi:hypothetical protein
MTSHRTISLTTTLLAVLMTAAPSSAGANSLLSGYGGPGEGNQTILGSALLGGRGGAGGGGGSSSSTSGSTGSSSSGMAGVGGKTTTSSGSSGGGATARGGDGRPAGGRSGSRGGSGGASGGAARTYTLVSPSSASPPASVASETLGLSGEDLGYVLLAFGVLAFTGVVTRRLARTTRPGGL